MLALIALGIQVQCVEKIARGGHARRLQRDGAAGCLGDVVRLHIEVEGVDM